MLRTLKRKWKYIKKTYKATAWYLKPVYVLLLILGLAMGAAVLCVLVPFLLVIAAAMLADDVWDA